MEEFYFEPLKIIDKRIKLSDYNLNGFSLLEYIFLSTTPKRIAQIFNELIDKGVIEIDEDIEYEVEAILDDAIDNDEKQYLVKWKNWHIEFSTWEPISHIKNCKQQLLQYDNHKGNQAKLMEQYAQPKLELIRQVMAIITRCDVNHKHVSKYMSKVGTKRPMKRQASNAVFRNRKQPKQSKLTLKTSLDEWQAMINKIYPLFDVMVENTQDNEGPPLDYEFITDYVSTSVQIPNDPPIGCNCSTRCVKNKECTLGHGSAPPYTVGGIIRIPPRVPVYECNNACSCNMSCPYRVVQRGVRMDLTIFRTTNRGWGLKTRKPVKKGTFMMEYLGEILTGDEAEERGMLYDQQHLTYLFDLDFAGDPEFTVDAYKKGNLAHFINHSCAPNMTSRCVYINCLDIRLPRIAFFAARDIRAGEELSFDYMMTGAMNEEDEAKEVDEELSTVVPSELAVRTSAISDIVSNSTSSINVNPKEEGGSECASVINSVQLPKRVKCLCKAKNCRKYLY